MKRKLAILGVLLFSVVAVSISSAPATAVVCGPVQQTALLTAGGSTCAMARTALQGVLTTAAGCPSGFCTKQFVYKECQVIQGGYSVSGYLRYSCVFSPN
jgi:hypothetical protein